MPSFKVILISRRSKKDNTCPLALRITSDRRSKYFYLNIFILEEQWDEINQKVRKNQLLPVNLKNILNTIGQE